MLLSWYQPTLRREDVEKLLKDLENGVFIVRDHIDKQTSKKMGYVISFKYEHFFISVCYYSSEAVV